MLLVVLGIGVGCLLVYLWFAYLWFAFILLLVIGLWLWVAGLLLGWLIVVVLGRLVFWFVAVGLVGSWAGCCSC